MSAPHNQPQVTPAHTFLLQKFLNKISLGQVFMNEGKRAVTGEAILGSLATIDTSQRERTHPITLEALVREHSRLVYRIAYAVLRSHHDAEDATQETFMRVCATTRSLPPSTNRKPGWRESPGA